MGSDEMGQTTLIDNRTGEIVQADDAWARHRRIVGLRDGIERGFLELGGELHLFHQSTQFKDMGHPTLDSYLADPDVDIGRRTAYRAMAVYRHYMLMLECAPGALLKVGAKKAEMMIPYATKESVQAVLADAGALSRSDLIKKYGGPTSDRDDYASDNWHTPAEYIEAAREVMGGIDLDPATCETAQEVVQADGFFTKDMEGLDRQWRGRVWLNPPYSMPSIAYFVAKVLDEYDQGHIAEAIVLVNNSSDTKWFHRLLDRCPACFTAGRVQFWHPDYKTFATRQGQAFFYLGPGWKAEIFQQVFSQFGIVVGRL